VGWWAVGEVSGTGIARPRRHVPPSPALSTSQTLLAAPPAAKADLKETRERTALARSALLRAAADWVTPAGVAQRRAYFAAKVGRCGGWRAAEEGGHGPAPRPPRSSSALQDTGVFWATPASKSAHEAMMTNPDAVTGMLKQSLGGIVPQVAMGTFVSFFFSGFILGRVPFPLSPSFRLMLQRGVDLPSLDVTYMTGLSLYILLLFGARGLFVLAFRESAVDDMAAQRAAMGGGGGGGPFGAGPPDPAKAFEGERAALALLPTGPGRVAATAEQAAVDALTAAAARRR